MFEIELAEVHLLHSPVAQETFYIGDAPVDLACSKDQLHQGGKSRVGPDADLPGPGGTPTTLEPAEPGGTPGAIEPQRGCHPRPGRLDRPGDGVGSTRPHSDHA